MGAVVIAPRTRTIRVPTDADYAALLASPSNKTWQRLPASWCCPACARSKREVMRWIEEKQRWVAGVHLHHDHLGEFLYTINPRYPRTFDSNWGQPFTRFQDHYVCELCNAADGVATQRRPGRINGAGYFSLSPQEIAQYITAAPYGNHTFDWAALRATNHAAGKSVAWTILTFLLTKGFTVLHKESDPHLYVTSVRNPRYAAEALSWLWQSSPDLLAVLTAHKSYLRLILEGTGA